MYIKGEFEKSLELYQKIDQLAEKTTRLGDKPFNRPGQAYTALGKCGDALEVLNASLRQKIVPFDKIEPLTLIAEVYFRQGKLAEALATCDESLSLSRASRSIS